MAKRTNRVAWGMAAILAGMVLGGPTAWAASQDPYETAKHHGAGASGHREISDARCPRTPVPAHWRALSAAYARRPPRFRWRRQA
jgi:hypothetical protein